MENKNKQIYSYIVLLEKQEEGSYQAFCPIVKSCHSQGYTFEEAIEFYLEV